MGPGNAALQRNLAELETEIGRLPEHPSSYIHDDVDGKVGLYQAARKIAFIKNLLTAEMDSRSGGRTEHLSLMATRLSILEKTFANWAMAARFPIHGETLVNWVESGDGDGAVSKSSDTSASFSCTESCVVDEEFVEQDDVNQDAKEFGASETETNLSQVSQVTESGRVESKEEGIEDEEENERNQEEEKEVTKDEKRSERKQGKMVGERIVEVNKDEEEGRESKVEVNDDEKVGEQQQEAEMVEETKVVVKEDAEGRDRDCKGKTVEKVEATEEKGRWKQDGEMVGERKFQTEEDKGNERREGEELVVERMLKEIEEAMALEKSTEAKDEKEIERNQERQRVGESAVEVFHDKQEESREEGEMMEATMRGRERKQEAEMVGMHKLEVKDDEKGRQRKQQSCSRVKNCMAIGCAAAAGFAIALIGVAAASICWVEEMDYLVPT